MSSLNKSDLQTIERAEKMSGVNTLEFGCNWRKQYCLENPDKTDCDWAAWSGLLGWELFMMTHVARGLEARIEKLEDKAELKLVDRVSTKW